ncbi:hypothetical protein PPL_04766 [Heterostelium album PN500]|uniref:Uncharacterized protein n=1 Tax=Heterostelium pallidum (strain ATCC 26659 / Pp 5 / PN500) TaxID=670386 RepID=D3B8H3_HETP5|nr:hypothetical protein PPL_04766 [Heterostelium album PN500]EFA82341.1 hypothetical protein PPL_04766 [Heterostelium album PN500]|eukprot:XP_020434458.1 hypothetical protein PPL_04766 [Heterostelium album PN500]
MYNEDQKFNTTRLPWILHLKILKYLYSSKDDIICKQSSSWRVSLSLVCWKYHSFISKHFFNNLDLSLENEDLTEIISHINSRYCIIKFVNNLKCSDQLLFNLFQMNPSFFDSMYSLDLQITSPMNQDFIYLLITIFKSLYHFKYTITNNNSTNNNILYNQLVFDSLNKNKELYSFKYQLNNIVVQPVQQDNNISNILSISPCISFLKNHTNLTKIDIKQIQIDTEFHSFVELLPSFKSLSKLVVSFKVNAELVKNFFISLKTINLSSLVIEQGVGDNPVHLNALVAYLTGNTSLSHLSLPSEITDGSILNVLLTNSNESKCKIKKLKLSPLIFGNIEQNQSVSLCLDKLSIRSIWSSYSFLDRLDPTRCDIKKIDMCSCFSNTSKSPTFLNQNTTVLTKDMIPYITANNKIRDLQFNYDPQFIEALKENSSINTITIQLISNTSNELYNNINNIFTNIDRNQSIKSVQIIVTQQQQSINNHQITLDPLKIQEIALVNGSSNQFKMISHDHRDKLFFQRHI